MDSTHIYTIYRATNTVNGKVYIGFTSNWPKRQIQHVADAASKGLVKFHRAIRKYGADAFTWDVIYQSKDADHCLNTMETHFIKEYDSFQNGYNATLGGDGTLGVKQTAEWIAKRIRTGPNDKKRWTQERKSRREQTLRNSIDGMSAETRRETWSRDIPKEARQSAAAKSLAAKTINGKMKHTNRVEINRIEYRSQAEASRQLGISTNSVKYRLNSSDWPNWIRL